MRLEAKNPYQFEIPAVPPMRVSGVVYATSELLPERAQNQALEQVANVATLPGIVGLHTPCRISTGVTGSRSAV